MPTPQLRSSRSAPCKSCPSSSRRTPKPWTSPPPQEANNRQYCSCSSESSGKMSPRLLWSSSPSSPSVTPKFKLQRPLQQSKSNMEKQEESANPMRRVELAPISKKLPKLNRVCPADAYQEKTEDEVEPSVCVTPAMFVKKGSSYLSKQEGPATVGNVMHVRPVYSLGMALKGLEILGHSSPFQVKKLRSFPSNKYELFEKATAASFCLTSNFLGSQYHLKGQQRTYLTIRFDVGCGSSQFRSCTIYALREEYAWNELQGNQESQDLEQLYQKGNNYQRIAKYATLQPTINPTTGAYMLKFSRKFVVPSVENTIICNLNGQKLLEMAKINELDSHFEVTQWSKMGAVKVLAIVLASLDFKFCTQ